jgi:hypothetical protein
MRRVIPPPLEPEPAPRGCDYPACAAPGHHRAPRSRDSHAGHYWFCLDHVRDYNASWDFFEGMSQHDIEAYQQSATTWHRPTWRMNTNGVKQGATFFADEFNFLGSGAPEPEGPRVRPVSGPVRNALAVLDLQPGASLQEVKSRYKTLAKRLHPDANGGRRDSEERLKTVNQAYTLLLTSGYA